MRPKIKTHKDVQADLHHAPPADCFPPPANRVLPVAESDLPAPPELVEYAPPEAFDRTLPQKKPRRPPRAEKTLLQYVEEFLAQGRLEHGATRHAAYARDLRQYVAWLEALGIKAPREINNDAVRRFAHDLCAGQLCGSRRAKIYAPLTIAAKLAAVRAWHHFLAREYRLSDPTRHLDELRTTATRGSTAYVRANFKKAHPRA